MNAPSSMSITRYFSKFWQHFLHPRVIIFMLIGIAVIFLTFLTSNNALEIAISGIASVFIGIGVNNLSTLEEHTKDELRLQSKIGHSLKVINITKSRVHSIHDQLNCENYLTIKEELAELEKIIDLSIDLIKTDVNLD